MGGAILRGFRDAVEIRLRHGKRRLHAERPERVIEIVSAGQVGHGKPEERVEIRTVREPRIEPGPDFRDDVLHRCFPLVETRLDRHEGDELETRILVRQDHRVNIVSPVGVVLDVEPSPVHHLDPLFPAVEIVEHQRAGFFRFKRRLPSCLEIQRVQQDHEYIRFDVGGRKEVPDHVSRAVLDVAVDFRDESFRFFEVLLVERPAVVLLDHGNERRQDVLFELLPVPDGIRHQDLDQFVHRVLPRNLVEELAAGRRIIGQAQRRFDLFGGLVLRAAVDQPERAVDAVRGDERVCVLVLLAEQTEEFEPLAVQSRGGFPFGGGRPGLHDCDGTDLPVVGVALHQLLE